MQRLSKKEAVLLGLLSKLRGPVVRTKLVKLVYLIDHLRAENLGETLTGFEYHWDHYGPNAIGNEIVAVLSSLSQRGFVTQVQRLTPYENYATYYAPTRAVKTTALPLSADDWAFVQSVVKRYGSKSREVVVRASKATDPVKRARQYQHLRLTSNADIRQRVSDIFADGERLTRLQEALSEEEAGTPLEDIKALYAQQP